MKPYDITATFPTLIVADFETFLTGVASPDAYLTKAKLTLDRATLHMLDAQMQTFQTKTHPRTDQEYYALLNLFHRICMATRFHIAQPVKGNLRMTPTETVAAFRQLSPCEKYVALLEALWVDVNWSDIAYRADAGVFPGGDFLMEPLLELPVGKSTNVLTSRGNPHIVIELHPSLRILSFFGLLACEESSDPRFRGIQERKGRVIFGRVTVSEFGQHVLRTLAEYRPRGLWNMPSRRESGGADFPGQTCDETEGLAEPEPFFKALLSLFPVGTLTRGLPRAERQTKKGTFVFKASLGGGVWRTIAMSGKDSLDDLHLAIQKVFQFDNDHLFGFFMDGKLHSQNRYSDSRGDDGPFAEDAVIGQLDLWLHQHFLYLFDFGDEWRFDVEVLEIRDEPHKGKPRVLESKGKSPKQYRDWDDNEE
jgi:hypothetical protein